MSRQLASILYKTGLLTGEQITTAQAQAEAGKRPLRQFILEEKLIGEEDLAKAFATQLRIPHLYLAASTIDPEAVKLVSEDHARKYICLPIKREAIAAGAATKRPTLVLAMADPTDLAAVQEIEFSTSCAVKPVVASETEVRDAIGRLYAPEDWVGDLLRGVEETENIQVFSVDEDDADETDIASLTRPGKDTPVVKLVNLIIKNAIKQGASDIHIETEVNHVKVRNRVQGMLREYLQMPKWVSEPLVSRIKILAKLDITDRRQPQDGRIKVTFDKREVDLRVSTLPTHFGEKVVMRILGSGQKVPSVASLGLAPAEFEIVKNAADQPQGMILVTGPTGSGKTTTLYALINEKKSPDINIVTVEDPIEFQLAGINQVQVNNKAHLTFAASLRSILRQDPDVILVGEIRDLETAEIAFHAALTGHLVLSTLHANSTSATIGRLLDLGVDPPLVTSALSVVIAQRLLRKLCEKCKYAERPTAKQLERLQQENATFTFFRAKGCPACDKTGYAGRMGVYEVLRLTPAIKEMIVRRASAGEIQQAGLRNGMVSLLQGAIDLVRRGITSVEEVLRTVELQEEEVIRCPNCGTLIDRQFSACPYCTHALKLVCGSCEQELKPGWRICPYCSEPVTKQQGLGGGTIPELPAPTPTTTPAVVGAADAASETEPGPHILVVDDDIIVRTVVAEALRALPSNPVIREASSGAEALAAVAAESPDLIVLDVMMPGMTGFEVCQQLRSNVETAFVPVMMLTANTDEVSRSTGFAVGTDDYMAKPVSIPELHARVARLLRRTYGM